MFRLYESNGRLLSITQLMEILGFKAILRTSEEEFKADRSTNPINNHLDIVVCKLEDLSAVVIKRTRLRL
jgi:hypothetical protein